MKTKEKILETRRSHRILVTNSSKGEQSQHIDTTLSSKTAIEQERGEEGRTKVKT